VLIVTAIEIYMLYSSADEVKCDVWGNCVFSTTLRNITTINETIINQTCYKNGKMVDCP
jgi:hypothetical protein